MTVADIQQNANQHVKTDVTTEQTGKAAIRVIATGLARLLQFAAMLLAACLIVFLALDLLPGNAATQQLGLTATAEQISALVHSYGLDLPVLERFAGWFVGALTGDLGNVLATGVAVTSAMAGPLERTAVMFICSLVLTAILGTGLGVLAGLHEGGLCDRVASACALALRSMPEFIAALVLMYLFATTLGLLPAVSLVPIGGSAFDAPEIFVLPITSITLMGMCSVVRPVRALVARQNRGMNVEAARLSGLTEARVVTRHLLPGCLAPILQVVAGVVPYLVGGTVVIERVFNFPGIGSLMVSAVQMREPNVLMACAFVMLGVSLASWWVADILGKVSES